MKRHDDSGMALMTVMILTVAVAGLILVITTSAMVESNYSTRYVHATRSGEAADAGGELAGSMLWTGYLASDPAGDGSSGTLSDFQAYLDGFVFDGATANILPVVVTLGNGSQIDSIQVARVDDGSGVTLTISSTGSSAGLSNTAVQTVRVGGQPFTGFDYAVLANNINCIMCHADFDDVYRVANTDPALEGTFDRLKIASLESLLIRVGSADSTMAGSYYTRGTITDKAGAPLTDLVGTTLNSFELDANGKLIEGSGGAMNSAEMPLAGTDIDTGYYLPNEYLYTDYPETEAEMTDGDLPTNFPPVFPDGNGNKLVDGTEFADMLGGSVLGSLAGGVVYGLPSGSTYGGASLPSTGNSATGDLSSTGTYSGNTFIIGSSADPIQIDGKIFVEGDVVIKGPVRGTGQIFASRNIYFVGDTVYDDAPGKYAEADDGTKNLVSYAAGGNILVGDYLTPKKIGKNNFDVFAPEYLTVEGIDPGGPPNSGANAGFVMSEVTLFNKMEYQKAQADATYTPRYYKLRDSDPVYRYTGPKEHGSKYDADFLAFTPAAGDAVISLEPAGSWMSELFLKQIWRDDENSRDPGGQPFKIDGLVYTNNAVMALARSQGKHNSRTLGQLFMRGGLVAADIGILSSGEKTSNSVTGGRGFQLHYDKRVSGFLSIEDIGNLQYTKRVRIFQ